jgi:Tfp pilus assembly PilM family ATPase
VNLFSLPARHFAVIEAGNRRTRILFAQVSRGRPKLVRSEIVDAHADALTTAEEQQEEIRRCLREAAPEAVVLVVPQALLLRHVLEIPPGDPEQERAQVEQEASRMGGLSDSAWTFDSVRLRPFGRARHPLAAVFCREQRLRELLDAHVEDTRLVFDVRPAGESLAAAFTSVRPDVHEAILVDLGALHTTVTVVMEGQAVSVSSFPNGAQSFTDALARDLGVTPESAETLARAEAPSLEPGRTPEYRAAVEVWLGELNRTLREWQQDHPEVAGMESWPLHLAGGAASRPGLTEMLSAAGPWAVLPWPRSASSSADPGPDLATAWGALLLSVGGSGPAPSLLPEGQRAEWRGRRFWRAFLSVNLGLAVVTGVVLAWAIHVQTRRLDEQDDWRQRATRAMDSAQEGRQVAESLNGRLSAFRPVLERQRQTVETLQILASLQEQRTNDSHWYVLLADAASYQAGSNHFAEMPSRPSAMTPTAPAGSAMGNQGLTNAPAVPRSFIAEVCLVPKGEQMRQALSELVNDLKRYPVVRNVDLLPDERRRSLVASNLVFPDRHFALELSLSEAELLSPVELPVVAPTNREVRPGGFRVGPRMELGGVTNGVRGGGVRPR